MAIAYHLVQPGMDLWQKARTQMGNTKLRRDAWYPVKIVEVHERYCIVHWNGNPARSMRREVVVRLYRKKPQEKQP